MRCPLPSPVPSAPPCALLPCNSGEGTNCTQGQRLCSVHISEFRETWEHKSCTLYIYVIFCCFSFGCATALFFADRVSLLCQASTPITLLCHFGLPGNHRVGCNMHLAHLSILCMLCGDGCVSALPSSHSQCFAESLGAPGSLELVAAGERAVQRTPWVWVCSTLGV